MFLYWLHIEFQNCFYHVTCKVGTFWGSEDILAGPHYLKRAVKG